PAARPHLPQTRLGILYRPKSRSCRAPTTTLLCSWPRSAVSLTAHHSSCLPGTVFAARSRMPSSASPPPPYPPAPRPHDHHPARIPCLRRSRARHNPRIRFPCMEPRSTAAPVAPHGGCPPHNIASLHSPSCKVSPPPSFPAPPRRLFDRDRTGRASPRTEPVS